MRITCTELHDSRNVYSGANIWNIDNCSGMLVQDPSKANDVDAIFNQARQLGAVERPIEQLRPSSSSNNFTGTGRLLSGETVEAAPQQPESLVHNIVFWSNGFTVNDGPLRRLDDPENASFLEVITIMSLNPFNNKFPKRFPSEANGFCFPAIFLGIENRENWVGGSHDACSLIFLLFLLS